MNRRRNEERRSHLFPFLALILAAVVGTTGGAMHAIYRTGQIKTERKIRQVQQRIEAHRLDIQYLEVRRDKIMDRYKLREQLEDFGSDLVPVVHGVVEKVEPRAEPVPVASRS